MLRMEKRPPLHLGGVAFEKGVCGSPSTKVDYINIGGIAYSFMSSVYPLEIKMNITLNPRMLIVGIVRKIIYKVVRMH